MSVKHILKIGVMGLAGCLWFSSAAAETSTPIDTPERFSVLVTYGDDECPEAEEDEIVVCAPQPESERYRIPKKLRKTEEDLTGEQSWSSRVATHEEVARTSRPNSCSVVGTNGWTGCQASIMRQWFDERRNDGQ